MAASDFHCLIGFLGLQPLLVLFCDELPSDVGVSLLGGGIESLAVVSSFGGGGGGFGADGLSSVMVIFLECEAGNKIGPGLT